MRQTFTALFQGDSMTAGMDRTSTDVIPAQDGDYLTRATFNYPYTFQSFMRQSSGATVNVVMRAVSGLTAEQAVNRPEWQTNPNCNIAFLMYGLNDTWTGVTIDSYMSSMETLIRRFIDWGMGVVVLTPASGGQGLTNGLAQIYGQRIKNLAKVYGCAHFDAHEAQYNRIFGVVQSDDTHFNSAGYSQLGVQIASMVMAGGLLEEYSPVSSERQTWPGKQDSSIGYCDAAGNMVIPPFLAEVNSRT
ncbi:SGNH/GDSL hydrolase family protein [Enterobacter kobei]|nr:SGNH/GDSL hydrolase family protein [Enterobacter kobei]UOY34682.1 SGNH/GDSL hydrolase family protein [Enterobacter kobei]